MTWRNIVDSGMVGKTQETRPFYVAMDVTDMSYVMVAAVWKDRHGSPGARRSAITPSLLLRPGRLSTKATLPRIYFYVSVYINK